MQEPQIVLKTLAGNPSIKLTALQEWLMAHLFQLEVLWWCIWSATLIYLLLKYLILSREPS